MRISTRRRSTLSTAFALLIILSLGAPAWAADPTLAPSGAQPQLDGRVTGAKSATSRLAVTDPQLLARNDAAMVNVVIKLDVDSVAVYDGGIADLAATSPRVTGKPLDRRSAAVKAYSAFIGSRQDAFSAALHKAVPSARLGIRLDTVYGGVAARIPASAVEAVLKIKGVIAVQADKLEHPLTDSSPSFVDADPVYAALGGDSQCRQGHHLRRPRHGRLAGAPVVRGPGQPARSAAKGGRHPADVRLRRQPADARPPTCSFATTS